jgi:hypothetical protein
MPDADVAVDIPAAASEQLTPAELEAPPPIAEPAEQTGECPHGLPAFLCHRCKDAAPAADPVDPIWLPDFDMLRAVADLAYPGRAEVVALIGKNLAGRGLAYRAVSGGDWVLSIKGRDRLAELSGAPGAAARLPPAPSDGDLEIPLFIWRAEPNGQALLDLARIDRSPPETVDDKLQTRLPLTEDELAMQAALLAIDAGGQVGGGMMRHLIGTGFAHATTSKILITDEGRQFLAQLVQVPAAELEAQA